MGILPSMRGGILLSLPRSGKPLSSSKNFLGRITMINWKLDLRLLSFIVLFIGLLMGIPTALAFNFQELDAIKGFLVAYAAIAVFCTTILISTGKSQNKQMLARDGYLVVTLTWIIATAFSAIPLVASGAYVDYPSAYFEVMSGFTTTGGATVLPEIESLPKAILFWRSQTNWLGGEWESWCSSWPCYQPRS